MFDLYEFEAVADGGDVGGGEPAEAAVEAPVEAPVAQGDPGDEQPEVAEAGFTPEQQSAIAEEVAAIVQAQMAQYQQPFQPPIAGATPGPMSGQPPVFDWTQIDPYGEDFGSALGAGLRAEIAAALGETLGPVTQTLEQAQEAQRLEQGEQYAQDMIADVITRKGDISEHGKSMLRFQAEQFMPEAVARYGETPRAAEMAINQAYDRVAAYEKELRESAIQQHANHVATLAGVPAEPGSSGIASTIPGQPAKYQTPDELVRKWGSVVRNG